MTYLLLLLLLLTFTIYMRLILTSLFKKSSFLLLQMTVIVTQYHVFQLLATKSIYKYLDKCYIDLQNQ